MDPFCKIIMSCIESPITIKSPLGSSLILETLRLGWYCLNSPIIDLQFFNFISTPLSIIGIVVLMAGFGRVGVIGGGSEEPVFCRVGALES